MSNSAKFWDVGPHSPLSVEKTFHSFVRKYGGVLFLMFYLEIHHLIMPIIHSRIII
jgi:hypothetical protein